eukprot:m.34564 g.34564  ORF g.34564 m.34564 type:complete len:325 (-) comp11037_c0_seq1:77-1051(-)
MPCPGWFSGKPKKEHDTKQPLLNNEGNYGATPRVSAPTPAASHRSPTVDHLLESHDCWVGLGTGLGFTMLIASICLCVVIFAPWAVVDVAVQTPGQPQPQDQLLENRDTTNMSTTAAAATFTPAMMTMYSFRSCLWTGKSSSNEVKNAILFDNHTGCVENKQLALLMRALGNETAQDTADAVEEPEKLLVVLVLLWALASFTFAFTICTCVQASLGHGTLFAFCFLAIHLLLVTQGILSFITHPSFADVVYWEPPNSTEPIGNMVFLSAHRYQGTTLMGALAAICVAFWHAAAVLDLGLISVYIAVSILGYVFSCMYRACCRNH